MDMEKLIRFIVFGYKWGTTWGLHYRLVQFVYCGHLRWNESGHLRTVTDKHFVRWNILGIDNIYL